MPAFDSAELKWRKSSACDPSECVEVASCGDYVLIRDSDDGAGPILEVRLHQWRAFIHDLNSRFGIRPRAGEEQLL